MELSSRSNESWFARNARAIGGAALAIVISVLPAAENAHAANPWRKLTCEEQAAENPRIKCPGKTSTSTSSKRPEVSYSTKSRPTNDSPWRKLTCEEQAATNPKIVCPGSSPVKAQAEPSPSKKENITSRPSTANPWLRDIVSSPKNPRPETVNSGPRSPSVTDSGPLIWDVKDARAASPVNIDNDTVNKQCSQTPSNEGRFYHERTRQWIDYIKADGECSYFDPKTGMYSKENVD